MHKLTQQQIAAVISNAATALANYCINSGLHYTVVGSSGGLDSAVTLGLAQHACKIARGRNFNLTSIGVTMPCESSRDSVRLGILAIETFGARHIHADLTEAYGKLNDVFIINVNEAIERILGDTGGELFSRKDVSIANGNIKARMRMMVVYHIARMLHGIVLSTDNWSELMMGFWTICGDVGDFGMIQNVLKGDELYDIARALGVPQEIIDARPDDGLGVTSGGDEAQLGASYSTVDKVMVMLIQNGFDPNGSRDQSVSEVDGVPEAVVRHLARRCLGTAYKRIGTINLTREELGLPEISEIEV